MNARRYIAIAVTILALFSLACGASSARSTPTPAPTPLEIEEDSPVCIGAPPGARHTAICRDTTRVESPVDCDQVGGIVVWIVCPRVTPTPVEALAPTAAISTPLEYEFAIIYFAFYLRVANATISGYLEQVVANPEKVRDTAWQADLTKEMDDLGKAASRIADATPPAIAAYQEAHGHFRRMRDFYLVAVDSIRQGFAKPDNKSLRDQFVLADEALQSADSAYKKALATLRPAAMLKILSELTE